MKMNGYYYAHQMSNRMFPSFVNVIKPKQSLMNKLISKDFINGINSLITGAQKVIKIYDQAIPIINQVRPLVGNVKTTLKVAKAFKMFSKDDTLEKAFDNLPDFENQKEEKATNKVANPYYP